MSETQSFRAARVMASRTKKQEPHERRQQGGAIPELGHLALRAELVRHRLGARHPPVLAIAQLVHKLGGLVLIRRRDQILRVLHMGAVHAEAVDQHLDTAREAIPTPTDEQPPKKQPPQTQGSGPGSLSPPDGWQGTSRKLEK